MTGKLFVYENVRVSEDRYSVSFDYRIETDLDTFSLSESITFPLPLPQQSDTVDRLLRALHLALGISYYKTFLPPEIDYAYAMNEDEATFWNEVFKHGLGEFLYKNNRSAQDLAQFHAQEGTITPGSTDDIAWQNSALLGIGGGKDSIVAGELLKELGTNVKGFVLATGDNKGQAQAVADVMGVDLLAIERRIDKKILELNTLEGALNGHIPISLIFALVGSMLAALNGSSLVIVANEASASIPHAEHEGNFVNHQWSKSLEFEKLFQEFLHQNISENLHYTSIVRQLSSVGVAKLFSRYPAYFEVFTSDNSHFKINKNEETHPRWGDTSAKSLSSFILLAPWIQEEAMFRAFGRNFLNKTELEDLFYNLLGAGSETILDCVGTPEELRLSLSLVCNKTAYKNAYLVQKAVEKNILITQPEEALSGALALSDDHALPSDIAQRVTKLLEEKLL
jgi:hypothetical protein